MWGALLALAAVVAFGILTSHSRRAEAAPPPADRPVAIVKSPEPRGDEGRKHGDEAQSGPIHDLDAQLKALRDEYKSQLDPLQTQIKALRDKYDPQIKDLEAKRRDLVLANESPDLRALDEDQDKQLAALADQEKTEIDALRQKFSDQRKALRASFDEKRRELKAAK
jgi:hypothetical protein